MVTGSQSYGGDGTCKLLTSYLQAYLSTRAYDTYLAMYNMRLFPLSATQCVKSVHIRSFSSPYSVRMRENKDQKVSEYGNFSRSEYIS